MVFIRGSAAEADNAIAVMVFLDERFASHGHQLLAVVESASYGTAYVWARRLLIMEDVFRQMLKLSEWSRWNGAKGHFRSPEQKLVFAGAPPTRQVTISRLDALLWAGMKYGTYRNRLRTLLSARALLLGLLNGANEPAPTPDTTPTSSKPKKRRQRRTPMNTPREDVLRSLKSLFAPALIATNSDSVVDEAVTSLSFTDVSAWVNEEFAHYTCVKKAPSPTVEAVLVHPESSGLVL